MNLLGKEGQMLKWDDACDVTFGKFKILLSSAGVLEYPKLDKKVKVYTNAIGFAIGDILMQDNHPVAYQSYKLTGNQLQWSIHEKKLYAVVHCLKTWRHYVGGKN